MKMKKLIVGLSLVMVLLLTGCSGMVRIVRMGNIIQKTFDFTNFTRVEVTDAMQYEIRQSDTYNINVSLHENALKYLDIHQSGETLYVGYRPGFFLANDASIIVEMPRLTGLVASGSTKGSLGGFDSTDSLNVTVASASKLALEITSGLTFLRVSDSSEVNGTLQAADTTIIVASASKLDMSLKTGKTSISAKDSSDVAGSLQSLDLTLKLEGASTCALTGSAGATTIDASDDSKISSGLKLQSANVKLTGASDADIYTDGALNINVSDASLLNYGGNPSIGQIDINGGSKVNHVQ